MANDKFEGINRDDLHDLPGSLTGGVLITPASLDPLHLGQRPSDAGESGSGIEIMVPTLKNPDALSELSRAAIGRILVEAQDGLPKPRVIISDTEAGPGNPVGPDVYLP